MLTQADYDWIAKFAGVQIAKAPVGPYSCDAYYHNDKYICLTRDWQPDKVPAQTMIVLEAWANKRGWAAVLHTLAISAGMAEMNGEDFDISTAICEAAIATRGE